MTPIYLLTNDLTWIVLGFVVQGVFAGGMYSQMPSYLTERFPTEVRATASAFCYHQAAIFGGSVALMLTYFAVNYQMGLPSRCWSAPRRQRSAWSSRCWSAPRPRARCSRRISS